MHAGQRTHDPAWKRALQFVFAEECLCTSPEAAAAARRRQSAAKSASIRPTCRSQSVPGGMLPLLFSDSVQILRRLWIEACVGCVGARARKISVVHSASPSQRSCFRMMTHTRATETSIEDEAYLLKVINVLPLCHTDILALHSASPLPLVLIQDYTSPLIILIYDPLTQTHFVEETFRATAVEGCKVGEGRTYCGLWQGDDAYVAGRCGSGSASRGDP
jgi:hypothetical protein